MSGRRASALRAVSVAAGLAWAAGAMAAESAPASPVSMWSLLQVLFGLGLVVAAIFATGWLLRRVGPAHSAGGLLRVLGGVMVGPRERLVLVEVGEQLLVLGVAGGSVNLLCTLPRTAVAASGGGRTPAPGGAPLDPAWLKRLLGASERKP